jgi:hypothetical protein
VFDAVGIRFRELPITPARFMDAVERKRALVRAEQSSTRPDGDARNETS